MSLMSQGVRSSERVTTSPKGITGRAVGYNQMLLSSGVTEQRTGHRNVPSYRRGGVGAPVRTSVRLRAALESYDDEKVSSHAT